MSSVNMASLLIDKLTVPEEPINLVTTKETGSCVVQADGVAAVRNELIDNGVKRSLSDDVATESGGDSKRLKLEDSEEVSVCVFFYCIYIYIFSSSFKHSELQKWVYIYIYLLYNIIHGQWRIQRRRGGHALMVSKYATLVLGLARLAVIVPTLISRNYS